MTLNYMTSSHTGLLQSSLFILHESVYTIRIELDSMV